ncbi:MAG: gamma-glutamyltransferase [Candidatus Polarisedimenticolia bacterium]
MSRLTVQRLAGPLSAALLVAVASVCLPEAPAAATRPAERARHVMVVGPEPLAVEEGLKVLREGGNAVDAAVTMGFVMAVTYPQAGNLGGGGFMLVQPPGGPPWFLDHRETAPAGATRDMFLDRDGNVVDGRSLRGHMASGVPGTVAGLALALEKGGTIPLRRAVSPAVRLAREGFVVPRGLAEALSNARDLLAPHEQVRLIFFKDGEPLEAGMRLVQPDLARTLSAIAEGGPRAFYEGTIAEAVAADMAAHGGLITRKDLAAYRPALRTPLEGTYRGLRVVSSPPPSSGGVALLQTLQMLEPFALRPLGHNSSAYVHTVSEALKRAFADRSLWLGDPDFVNVPVQALVSSAYTSRRMAGFRPDRATPADQAGPGRPVGAEGSSTTQVSIVDAGGMAVSYTTTLNELFGSGVVPRGTGFLLNSEMDDFSIKPGVPNLYGLVGAEANSIAPGKRMLSSMTPTIVTTPEGQVILVLGSPGGPAIISAVLQVLLNYVDFGMELQAAVSAPRFHHQWLPDRIELDEGDFPADVLDALKARGHGVHERAPRCEVQTIRVDRASGWIYGAADPRRYGVARGY